MKENGQEMTLLVSYNLPNTASFYSVNTNENVMVDVSSIVAPNQLKVWHS